MRRIECRPGTRSGWIAVVLCACVAAGAALPAGAAPRVAPWVIGHRGASTEAPENTLASFRQAIDAGADVLEMDCQTTADGTIIVLHDLTVDRTTDGHGRVSKMSLEGVRRLDAGSWKDPRFAGERIPTLHEAAMLAREAHIGMLPEAKAPFADDPLLVRRMVAELDADGMLAVSAIQSFDHRPLGLMHKERPEVRLAPLAEDPVEPLEPVLRAAGAWTYLPCGRHLTREVVEHVHALGVTICPWTVDDARDWARCLAMSIDGIITNRPRALRRMLDKLGLPRRPWPGPR